MRSLLVFYVALLTISLGFVALVARRMQRAIPYVAASLLLVSLSASASALFLRSNPLYEYVYYEVFPGLTITLLWGSLNIVFILTLSLVGIAVVFYSAWYVELDSHTISRSHYWFTLLLLLGIQLLIVQVSSLIGFIVLLEASTLVASMLIASDVQRHHSRVAGRIYLMVDLAASTFVLIGIATLISLTGYTDIESILATNGYIVVAPGLGLALMLIGFLVKAGLFPFHGWLPPVHSEAPAPVSALLSGYIVNVGFYGLLLFMPLAKSYSYILYYTLLFTGLASIIYGGLSALAQTDQKRLLAWSTVASNGYMALALATAIHYGSYEAILAGAIGLSSAMLYMVSHSVAKSTLFLFSGIVEEASGTRRINLLGRGLEKYRPIKALLPIACLMLIGLPPSLGFLAKTMIHTALLRIQLTYIADVSIALFSTLLTSMYTAKFMYPVFTRFSSNNREGGMGERRIPQWIALSAALPLVINVICLNPALLIPFINSLTSFYTVETGIEQYVSFYPFVVIVRELPSLPPLTLLEEILIVGVSLLATPIAVILGLLFWRGFEARTHAILGSVEKLFIRPAIIYYSKAKVRVTRYIELYEDYYTLSLAVSILTLLALLAVYLLS